MIDHSGHPHPSTPAARAKCRANGGTGDITSKPKTTSKAPSVKKASAPVQKRPPALTEAKVPTAANKRAAPPVEPVPTDPVERERYERAAKRQHRPLNIVKGRDDVRGLTSKIADSVSDADVAAVYGAGQDALLTGIMKEQGWHGKPSVVTKAQMDGLIAAGAEPLYRGVKPNKKVPRASDFLDSLRGEPGAPEFGSGTGAYGNGIYFSDKRSTAERFASNRMSKGKEDQGIVRAVISPNARTIDYETAKQRSLEEVDRIQKDPAFDAQHFASPEWRKSRKELGIVSDPGRWAAMAGYDVMTVDNEHDGVQVTRQQVVLNRTVLILEDNP